jgi:predicted Zn-dependent protease
MSIAYSKYAEDEADQYAFETLIRLGYSPFALSATFKKLYSLNENNKSKSNILIDFFKTHPSLPIRIENWHEAAVRFSKLHPNFHEGR